MWMNFNFEGTKQLSQVELLTLCMVPEDTIRPASSIIEGIEEAMSGFYQPKRGSIYPILYRLEDNGLISQDPNQSRKAFVRTPRGSSYISSITNDLLDQARSNFLFTHRILEEIIAIDPFTSLQILSDFREHLMEFLNTMEKMKEQAEEKDREDGWTDISLS